MRDSSAHSYHPYDDEDERPIAEYLESTQAKGLEQAHQVATAYLNRNRMDQSDYFQYSDTFPAAELREDFQTVSTQRAKNNQSPTPEARVRKQIADIQEALVHKGIKSLNWFENNSSADKRNDYDDFFQQTDIMAVSRTTDKEGNLKLRSVLAIDVTTSEKEYKNKLEMILTKINYMPETLKYKYFVDEETGRRGSFVMPKIALYSPIEEIVERFPQWINHDKDAKPLENDPLQMEYLQQALVQTTLFMNKIAQAAKTGKHSEYRMQAYKDLIKRYASNVKLIRTALINKVKELGQYPKPTIVLGEIAKAGEVSSSTLKKYALGSEQDPILMKLIERMS